VILCKNKLHPHFDQKKSNGKRRRVKKEKTKRELGEDGKSLFSLKKP